MARRRGGLSPAEAETMRLLLADVVQAKPRGWSAVMGAGALVLRPADRSRGKFNVSLHGDQFRIRFFDYGLGHWAARHAVPAVPDAAAALLSWAEAVAGAPGGSSP